MITTHFNKSAKVFITLCAIALTFAGITSCKKNKDAELRTFIMATNSAEGSAPQDFVIDNNKANINALAYTQATAYVGVKAGDNKLQFVSSGTTTVNSEAALATQPGNYYSAFYLDDKSTVTLKDDHTDPQAGKARVRFINLSSVITTNVDVGLAAGTKLATGLARKVASVYYEVNAPAVFSLYTAGSTSVLLNIPVAVQAGHVYTVYISGSSEATLASNLMLNK
jgi:hypothetical protein